MAPALAPPRPDATAVVVGFGVTGRSVTALLAASGWRVVVIEDAPGPATAEEAGRLGARVGTVADVAGADLVVPSPGVRPSHPVHAAAAEAGVPVFSEIELAGRLADEAGKTLVAVTGTNGKTSVTTLVAGMLAGSGRAAVAAGNIGLPLVEAVQGHAEVVVAEVSSFQLQYTERFRPHVAVWLNLAQDHLDWHPDAGHYADAKARIWANHGHDDVAVVNAEDEAVTKAAVSAPGRVVTFGVAIGDYCVVDGELRAPGGTAIVPVARLPRRHPHDLSNAVAAVAAAVETGADLASCRSVLVGFEGLPHRLQLVGESGGVRYYDDSKATTPASVLCALRAFPSAILVAGGRNKGLDLSPLRQEASRLRHVVAIGEAAPEVAAVFAGAVPVTVAESMPEAVAVAASAARPGDAVVLSPGCSSFDWYGSYAERGDAFTTALRQLGVTG